MPRFPSAQGRLNHEPGFHLSCDENLSEGWGPPLSARNTYCQADIFDYVPSQRYQVVLFRDSLYYVTKIDLMLTRYSAYLEDDGVFIVRIAAWDERHRWIEDTIGNGFDVVEKDRIDEPRALIVVFRPRSHSVARTSGDTQNRPFMDT